MLKFYQHESFLPTFWFTLT